MKVVVIKIYKSLIYIFTYKLSKISNFFGTKNYDLIRIKGRLSIPFWPYFKIKLKKLTAISYILLSRGQKYYRYSGNHLLVTSSTQGSDTDFESFIWRPSLLSIAFNFNYEAFNSHIYGYFDNNSIKKNNINLWLWII